MEIGIRGQNGDGLSKPILDFFYPVDEYFPVRIPYRRAVQVLSDIFKWVKTSSTANQRENLTFVRSNL